MSKRRVPINQLLIPVFMSIQKRRLVVILSNKPRFIHSQEGWFRQHSHISTRRLSIYTPSSKSQDLPLSRIILSINTFSSASSGFLLRSICVATELPASVIIASGGVILGQVHTLVSGISLPNSDSYFWVC